MDLNTQAKNAKNATNRLLKYILSLNKELNPNGEGCWIDRVDIRYSTDQTNLSIVFGSQNNQESPVTTFVCSSSVYEN